MVHLQFNTQGFVTQEFVMQGFVTQAAWRLHELNHFYLLKSSSELEIDKGCDIVFEQLAKY